MTVTIKFKMSILLRLKNKTAFIFFGEALFLEADNFTMSIEETQVSFVAVNNFRALVMCRKILAENHCDIAARLKDSVRNIAVVFAARESQMIVCGHIPSKESRHARSAFSIVVKLHVGESVKDSRAVEFNFFPRKIRRKVKAKTRLHFVLVGLADSLSNLIPQRDKKGIFISKKQTGFGNARFLHRRHGTAPRRVEASGSTASACVLAHVEARQIRRRKVNPEGDPTELFTFAGLSVSRVEELHTAKEYTRGKILQGFSAFHTEKKDCAFLALRLTRCVKNFLRHDVTR